MNCSKIAAAIITDRLVLALSTRNSLFRESIMAIVFHFIGAKSNPYPWMRVCDIYVQPSRYEGHSVTVREAQILGKPVIITNYPTAKSQIHDGVDGIICGMDNESIAHAIFSLARDREKQEALAKYVSSHDYGDEKEIEKIYQLLNIA